MTDEEIMLAVANGRIRLLSTLFERYSDRLYSYFLRMTYDKALSDDLTQDVFERIIKYRKTYRKEFRFGPWLFRVAHNVRMDHYRSQKKKKVEGIAPDTLRLSENTLEAGIEKRQMERDIESALRQLKPAHREVLLLTRYQKMKYREVAELLQVTESTIKVRVHRAVQELSDVYKKIIAQ